MHGQGSLSAIGSAINLQPVAYGRFGYNFEITGDGSLINHSTIEHEFQGSFVSGRMEKKVLVDSSVNATEVLEED